MRYKWLKWLRLIIALIFFILISLIFIDFRNLFEETTVRKILWLQFTPSVLKFIAIFSLSAIGFIVVLLMTILFGRIYCSVICPLGILQDFISRIAKFLKIRKRYKYRKANTLLRNIILALLIISLFTGSLILLNLLDPYSLYGKFAAKLLMPLGMSINNLFAAILESRGIYHLYHIDILPIHIFTIILPLLLIFTLILMAGKYGRLYCNTICPIGTLFGWISKFSAFRIDFDRTKCTKCAKCAFVCKSECISIKELTIDHSRCVACFNCLVVCQDDAIDYKFIPKKEIKNKEKIDSGKRKFLALSMGALAFYKNPGFNWRKTVNTIVPLNKKPTTIPEVKNYPVSPPGSLSIDHFTSLCTACQLCVSQCPTKVLQPSVNQYGWSGYMQPYMDYNTNYCNYECVKCTNVCPTGAILSLTEENKISTQIGKVFFEINNCVVYTENTACGSCSEHCPTQAVTMVPYIDNLTIPEIDVSICVGCGACEYACPVTPYKAIYVDGNPIHEIAKQKETEKLDGSVPEEFPF